MAPSATASGVTVGDVVVTGGKLPDIERIVAGMRAGFRSCYARGLKTNPDIEGEVTLTIRLGVAGQVLGVSAHVGNKVPQPVVSCITTRAAATEYEVPQGGGTSVVVPLTLVKP
jgi:hypothetical protein